MTFDVKKFNKRKRSCAGNSMVLKNAIPTTSSVLSEKSRFAETILKAQEKMIVLNGAGNNNVQIEKEILGKRKAYTEAKVRCTEIEIMQRDKQRKAARISLEKMAKTVEWNDAIHVEKEFEKLIGCSGNGKKKPTCGIN